MAQQGQIIELRCEMPGCYCPQGRKQFDAADQSMPPWAPKVEHYPQLASDGGKRTPGNVRLAHTYCNNADYGWRSRIRVMLDNGQSLQQIAEALNDKGIQPKPGQQSWTPASVRWTYVS